MKYLEFRDNLKDFLVFSANDILKIDPNFHKQRLIEWQRKGYIKKITKGFYIFADLKMDEPALFVIANAICQPSYVSMEMALSYHGLIPESVYSVTSVTSRLTRRYATKIGHFVYRKIKPELMFGYELAARQNHNFKIAEIEKAVLDYFYINSGLKTEEEFEELRINKETFRRKIDTKKLDGYLSLFNNKALEKRVNQFKKYILA